jgi:hypothetical protein
MSTVYWACLNPEWMRVGPPTSVLYSFMKGKSAEIGYLRCPSTKKYLQNLYSLNSLYEYNFEITDTDVLSDCHNQEFFNKNFDLRSLKDRLFGISYIYVFFTEEETLDMELTPAFLEDSDFCNKTTIVPGVIDIGKYFRTTDCAFHVKTYSNSVYIQEGAPYAYINFRTEDRVELKQFIINDSIIKYLKDVSSMKDYRNKKYRILDWYYNNFKRAGIKNRIITEIKKCLC